MTMFLAVDLHEFVFVAADQQVTNVKVNGSKSQSHKTTKILNTEKSICTGCGLQYVVEHLSSCFSEGNIERGLREDLTGKYPIQYLSMTKVVLVPVRAVENERIIFINFDNGSLVFNAEYTGGVINGSDSIEQRHIALLIQASSEFVKNKSSESSFAVFLEAIDSIFKNVSSMTPDVSDTFDFAIQYPDGTRFFNERPV